MMGQTVRRILVAVDLSKSRDAAFDNALALARSWNAELYLVHARHPRHVSRVTTTGQELETERSEGERSQLRQRTLISAWQTSSSSRVILGRHAPGVCRV